MLPAFDPCSQLFVKGARRMLLFKYFGPPATKSSFRNHGEFTLRFNLPQSYNDPYELFLLPDEPLAADEERAYYENFLKQLPQAPVTCFSRRPESIVMWAHYGQLSTGVCLVLNEDSLFAEIDGGFMEDVEYSDEPAVISADAISHACTTKKNRHTLFLLASANRAAYFRKRTSWSYEEERRLVVPHSGVEDIDGIMLGKYSSKCLEKVIIGANASEDVRDVVTTWAENSNVETLQMHYSRRLANPFFRSQSETLFWLNSEFKVQKHCCQECFEPLDTSNRTCRWCELSEAALADSMNSIATVAYINAGVMEGIQLDFEGLAPRGRKFLEKEQ